MSLKLGLLASSQQQAAPLLLDAYPGAAAAYSFRKLRTAYTGNCIQVRRVIDNAILDIGFLNNVLDITTLQTFIGSGTGSLNIWYDQSGNGNNAIRNSVNNAPIIIQSGVLITDGGKVSSIIGADQMNITNITQSTNYAGFSVMSRQNSTDQMMSFGSSSTPFISLAYFNGFLYNNNGAEDIGYAFNSISRFLFTTLNISNSQNAFLNSVLKIVTRITYSGSNVFSMINSRGAVGVSTTKAQEHILYNTDQSSNRTGIETNINSYYLIY